MRGTISLFSPIWEKPVRAFRFLQLQMQKVSNALAKVTLSEATLDAHNLAAADMLRIALPRIRGLTGHAQMGSVRYAQVITRLPTRTTWVRPSAYAPFGSSAMVRGGDKSEQADSDGSSATTEAWDRREADQEQEADANTSEHAVLSTFDLFSIGIGPSSSVSLPRLDLLFLLLLIASVLSQWKLFLLLYSTP